VHEHYALVGFERRHQGRVFSGDQTSSWSQRNITSPWGQLRRALEISRRTHGSPRSHRRHAPEAASLSAPAAQSCRHRWRRHTATMLIGCALWAHTCETCSRSCAVEGAQDDRRSKGRHQWSQRSGAALPPALPCIAAAPAPRAALGFPFSDNLSRLSREFMAGAP